MLAKSDIVPLWSSMVSHSGLGRCLGQRSRWRRDGSTMSKVTAPSAFCVSAVRQAYPCADDRFIASIAPTDSPESIPSFKDVYDELLHVATPRRVAERRGLSLLENALERTVGIGDDLPGTPDDLLQWMDASAHRATDAYQNYLAARKAGAPRRFFKNRSHALHFLQAVAPTKLVDGSWLYGALRHGNDARLLGLVQTYLEELGNGDVTKNHVLLYRELLHANGLSEGGHLPDDYFEQGAIQLALGHTIEHMLPEVIGFNLGYEQLPLHLLITSYELNELGIDPYYFTLHVTVDNADSGHARKAVDAVSQNMGRFADADEFWARVRRGYRLNELGLGTNAVIAGFNQEEEVLRILSAKSVAGAGAHSDYCRIEGRTVNQWLSEPQGVRGFVDALVRKDWILLNQAPAESRFWQLLVGDRAEMFGVFSDYELQVIHDWIRGEASADGRRFDSPTPRADEQPTRVLSFRAAQKLRARVADTGALSPKTATAIPLLRRMPDSAANDIHGEAERDVLDLLAPDAHWTPDGLAATQRWVRSMRGE